MTIQFTSIASAQDIEPGTMKQVMLEGTNVVVANVDGEFFAFGGKCICLSHFSNHRQEGGGITLADGELAGSTIACPSHGTVYDVRDGCPIKGLGEVPVNTYEVKNYRGELRIATMTDSERRFWNAA